MLCDTKAKCTFRRSKTFSAAQGLRASNLDHNNAYDSITVHWFAGNRAPCKWFSIGFILGLLWAVGLYDCQQKTVWHKRVLCKTACAVFSTPWNILMTLSARRAGSSHRDPTLETVGTDLNNPHFSRSPGGSHAHLLTAGVRSCCPFSTSLTLTETHTHTILHYTTHTRTLSQVVKYDTRSPVRRDKSIQTAGACWILEHIHTHTKAAACLLILLSPFPGSESWTTGVLSFCLPSAAVYACAAFLQSTLPLSPPLINKQFTIQT